MKWFLYKQEGVFGLRHPYNGRVVKDSELSLWVLIRPTSKKTTIATSSVQSEQGFFVNLRGSLVLMVVVSHSDSLGSSVSTVKGRISVPSRGT